MIDKSGEYWTGSEPADLDEYLAEITAENYAADRFVHATCSCGGRAFRLEADANEGVARRTCVACNAQHYICDSDEHWDEAEPEPTICACNGDAYELAVAFSHREDGSIKWLTVGERCIKCGTLGSAADWKIDYEPSGHLYDRV